MEEGLWETGRTGVRELGGGCRGECRSEIEV